MEMFVYVCISFSKLKHKGYFASHVYTTIKILWTERTTYIDTTNTSVLNFDIQLRWYDSNKLYAQNWHYLCTMFNVR